MGFSFTPQRHELPGLTLYRPAWTPDPGIDYRLESAAATLQLIRGGFYQLGTGLPYNLSTGFFSGSDYTLIAPDGTRYGYDSLDGLREIVSASGVRLVFSDSGIVAPSGSRVSFTTDSAGRLTSVLADDGTQLQYQYDAQGNLTRVTNRGADLRSEYGYHAAQDHLLTEALSTAAGSESIQYDTEGTLAERNPLDRLLGSPREFIGAPWNGTLAEGQVERQAIVIVRR